MKVIKIASRILNYVAAVFIGFMMIIITCDVVLRYTFNSPITGSVEIVEFTMICAVFPALALCALVDGHVKVDLVLQRFPRRIQSIFDSVTYLAGLSVCIVILWQAISESIYIQQRDMTSSLLDIPIFPFYWVIAISYVLLSVVIILKVIQKIQEACNR
jgi:TRAP-type transport system small permease protein